MYEGKNLIQSWIHFAQKGRGRWRIFANAHVAFGRMTVFRKIRLLLDFAILSIAPFSNVTFLFELIFIIKHRSAYTKISLLFYRACARILSKHPSNLWLKMK